MVELLVTVVILSVVTAAVYQLYLTQYRHSISQDLRSEMLQRVRVSLQDMTRDMQMAGFKPRVDAVNTASATQFTFEVLNNLLPSQPIGFTKDRRITYRFDAGNNRIMKRTQAWNTAIAGADKFTTNAEEVYLENITGLTFSYFDKAGATMANPVAAGDLDDIRRVDVTITAETSDDDPITRDRRSITLTSQVFPRNLGIEESTLDQTCPATPTGLASLDPNACGQLDLSWNANVEADLAGYRIHYGLAPGLYTGVVNIGEVSSYTLDGLTDGAKYYIALGSFDESSNSCALSSEVSGTGPGNPDTQPDPGLPQQTLQLDATATGANVNLTWQENDDAYPGSRPDSDANVEGYDIYRSVNDGASYVKIASKVSGGAYADAPGASLSCKVLWYKVEPVNCLDQPGPASDVIHGDGSGLPDGSDATDVPQDGITNTAVTNSSPPAVPSKLDSKSGYQRNYLVWDNPPDPDFSHTVIRYSKITYPAIPGDGLPVENAPGGNGRFDGSPGQTMTFTHDGGTIPPSLDVNTVYYYTIFAYDLCGNVSAAQASAQTAAAQCGDEPVGPSSGPPPVPTLPNPSYTNSCESNEASVRWELIDDTFPGGVFDLAGYNVYRSKNNIAGPFIKQNASILFGNYPGIRTYNDTTVTEGDVYYYRITATDCDWEVNGGANGGGESGPSVNIKVAPGRLTRSTANPQVLSTGDHHEKVVFWIKNTKANPAEIALGQIRLKSLRLDYQNPSARVAKVTILNDLADALDDEVLYQDNAVPITIGSGVDILLSGGTVLDGQEDVAVEIEFRTPLNTVEDLLDMRGLDIDAVWDYENVATTLDDCGADMKVRVPLSPLVDSTVQDRPFAPTNAIITPGVIAIMANQPVNVLSTVRDDDGRGIVSVQLFWATTASTETVPPSVGWTTINMVPLGGGAYVADDDPAVGGDTRIPAQNGLRIWYYVIAVDALGNYDRNPERDLGAFVYDQKT